LLPQGLRPELETLSDTLTPELQSDPGKGFEAMADQYQVSGPLPDRSFHVVEAAIVAIVVPTIAVVFRCCSRTLAKAGFWWDDWVIIVSLGMKLLTLSVQLAY